MAEAGNAEKVKLATQAYVYGYPLVYNLSEIGKYSGKDNLLGQQVALNTFGAARQLLGPDAKFVTPNNDTLYVVAPVDVSSGPVVLHVPDTDDRYYVLQFVDAWTNNFAYIGRRATGTAEAEFLLAPGGYSGDVPVGADGQKLPVVHAPTNLFVIVGRVQVNGEADLPAVHALQDQFTLRPLAADQEAAPGVPQPDPGVGDGLAFWEQFRVALAAYPPPAADQQYLDIAAGFGLTAESTSYADPDPELAATLVEGQKQGAALIEELGRTVIKQVDGWTTAVHAFDYNLDYFELGTVDAPEWKIADRTTAYVTRACAARLGLWGNHGYEARYDILWQDEHDEDLDGSRVYELTLSPPPPVDAFWSITMYDKPEYYLVENPIARYAVGDRTPGLEVGADGSVVIRIQHAEPPADQRANWLPAPAGGFRPVFRAYQPRPEVLEAGFTLPKVKRIS